MTAKAIKNCPSRQNKATLNDWKLAFSMGLLGVYIGIWQCTRQEKMKYGGDNAGDGSGGVMHDRNHRCAGVLSRKRMKDRVTIR